MSWVGTAASVAGAAYGIYSQNKADKENRKISDKQNELFGIQAGTARQLQPFAIENYKKAGEGLLDPLAYYRSIIGGDRSKVMSAMSPQLAAIGKKYRSIMGASREMNPRSGASASYNTDLAFRAGDEQQGAINTEHAGAYGNLARIAGMFGDLGGSALGHASNAGSAAMGITNNAWAMNAANAESRRKAYDDMGDSLAEAYDQWSKRGKKV
jgi:hypothetical protein